MMNYPVGIYEISENDYHNDPVNPLSASCSVLQTLYERSPLHAKCAHPKMNQVIGINKSKFDIGSAFHKIMLGKGREIVPLNYPDWRTKEAREQRDMVYRSGKIPMKLQDLSNAQKMSEMAWEELSHHETMVFESEKTIIWEEDGYWFRCRPDMLCLDQDIIGDLKATETSAAPDAFSRHIYSMGYDFRSAYYARGYKAVTGRDLKEYRIIPCETEDPHAVAMYALTQAAMDFAAKKVDKAISVWKECLKKNEWPGYPKRVCYVDAPKWAENKQIERELSEI